MNKIEWLISYQRISKLCTYFQVIITQEYSKSFYDEYEHDFIQSKMIEKCISLFKILKYNQFYIFNIFIKYINLDMIIILKENKKNNIDWFNNKYMKLKINDKNIIFKDFKKYIIKK